MKDLQQQAEEFRHYYQVRNSIENREMQLNLIKEEFAEFIEAEAYSQSAYASKRVDALKELADLVYVAFQYAENREWDLLTALNRVHESNMSKLGPDMKPIRREDGKIMKGPNYFKPDLTDLV